MAAIRPLRGTLRGCCAISRADGQGLLVVADGSPCVAQLRSRRIPRWINPAASKSALALGLPHLASALEVAQGGIGLADVQVGHTYRAVRPAGRHPLGPAQRAGCLGLRRRPAGYLAVGGSPGLPQASPSPGSADQAPRPDTLPAAPAWHQGPIACTAHSLPILMRPPHLVQRPTLHQHATGQHLAQDAAQGVDVGLHVTSAPSHCSGAM